MKFKTTLMTGALLLVAQTAFAVPFDYSCGDCPQLIPADGSTAGTTVSTLTVTDTGTVADLSIFIDAFHSFEGDLVITLEHNGVTATLQDSINGAADYLGNTYGALAAFNGAELAGDWVLTFEDQFGGDSGELFDWNIFGDVDAGGPIGAPEPGILVLMGLGLAGLGFARRRS